MADGFKKMNTIISQKQNMNVFRMSNFASKHNERLW